MQTAVKIDLRNIKESDIIKALNHIETNFREIQELRSSYCDKVFMSIRRITEDRSSPNPEFERRLAQDFYRQRGIQDSSAAIKLTSLMYEFEIPSIEYLLQ